MKNFKFSRRSFLKAGAAASVASLVAANAAAASAAEPKAPAADENGLLDGLFGGKTPKYIFLFIGDGMGLPQIQSASFYKGTVENNGAVIPAELSFMKFPFTGSVTTYDSTSFCPDSASTATSIASGEKTESGVINMTPWTRDVPFETIAEKLHKQKGYKIGVLTTVNIDHATPAAFYAHQAKRSNYYEIGQELANSGFEYFAGGDFQNPRGGAVSNYDMAIANGYNLVTTQAGAEALKAGAGKTLIIAEHRADAAAMNYSIDAAAGEWQLSDYVRKGIELLDNPTGFFMMAESGKIDWACHANDTAASIHDVLEMSNAVQVAVDFYNQHPNDTLILVTADHETGGMTIGFTTTNYDTYLTNLTKQTTSFIKFDSEHIDKLRAVGASFEDALTDVKNCFGLITANDPDASNPEYENLILTDYELDQLREAYQRSMTVGSASQDEMSQRDYELYGTYQPFSAALCHVLNHKSGMDHTTWSHTGAPVNIYAIGAGSDKFTGAFDNTEIFHKLAELTNVQ